MIAVARRPRGNPSLVVRYQSFWDRLVAMAARQVWEVEQTLSRPRANVILRYIREKRLGTFTTRRDGDRLWIIRLE